MNKWLAGLGIILTTAYIYLVTYIVNGRLHKLFEMDLNEIGDFLAGAFGPIAIFWLILGFFQQGMELRQNNEALKLQAEELKNAVDQQKELVAVTKQQAQANAVAFQEEMDRRTKELEPIFAFDSFECTTISNGAYIFTSEVTNAGNNITALTIATDQNDIQLKKSSIPSLFHSASTRISLTCPGSLPNELLITFKYITTSGESRLQQFNMALKDNPEKNVLCYVRKNS